MYGESNNTFGEAVQPASLFRVGGTRIYHLRWGMLYHDSLSTALAPFTFLLQLFYLNHFSNCACDLRIHGPVMREKLAVRWFGGRSPTKNPCLRHLMPLWVNSCGKCANIPHGHNRIYLERLAFSLTSFILFSPLLSFPWVFLPQHKKDW